MSFTDFMKEFRGLYLPPDWEQDLRRSLMSAMMGTRTFWDYASKIQNQNFLLAGTDSHLREDKLRHQLEVGMTDKLTWKCKAEKAQDVLEFQNWLLEVKRLDDAMCTDRLEFEEIARATRADSHKVYLLGEPSRHGNALPNNNFNRSNNAPASGSSTPRTRVPKLTEEERSITSP
jgi:hypothetical protein